MASNTAPPNAPNLLTYLLYQTVGLVIFAVLLLPNLVCRTALHYIPGQRPHPTWSLQRNLAVSAGRLYLAWTKRFSLPRPEGKAAWKDLPWVQKLIGKGTTVKAVEIPPAGKEWIGDLMQAGEGIVQGVKVPGFWTYEQTGSWMDGSEQAIPGEKVIMYISGGSWVMGHPMGTPFPYRFCSVAHQRVLSVNHRKALNADSAFPAQLLDALAGFVYLLSLGFESRNISLIGDSSGAHIHLALWRHLSEIGQTKEVYPGLPGALLLVSPSSDLSHAPAQSKPTDFLVPYINQRAIPSLTRHYPTNATSTNPYFSPAVAGSFESLAWLQAQHGVRVWIQYSTTELLAPDQEKLVRKMRAGGVKLEVDVIEGGAHLDAGIAFALLERHSNSSWMRLLAAVERIAA